MALSVRSVRSFRHELEKIALGWKAKLLIPPAIGLAGLGYGAYRLARFGKGQLDQVKEHDQRALRDYDSPMNQQQMTSPYGPYVY